MDIGESLRRAILGSPVQMPEDSTSSWLFISSMMNNMSFDIFLLCVCALFGLIVAVMSLRDRRGSKELRLCAACALVILSLVEYGYVARIVGTDATLHNEQVTSRIEETISNTKSYLSSVFSTFGASQLLRLADEGGEKDTNKVISRIQALLAGNQSLAKQRASTVVRKSSRHSQLAGQKSAQPTNSSAKSTQGEKIQLPTAGLSVASTSKTAKGAVNSSPVAHVSKDASNGTGSTALVNTKDSNPQIGATSRDSVVKIKAVDVKADGSDAEEIILISAPSPSGSSEQPDEDYIKAILGIFNREIEMNNKAAAYLGEVASVRGPANKNLKAFNKSFQQFYTAAMGIESEMSSFNASPRYFQYEVSDLNANAKDTLAVADILDSLVYSNSSGAGKGAIFDPRAYKSDESAKLVTPKSHFFLTLIRICMVVQIGVGCALLCALGFETGLVGTLTVAATALLIVNALFGVYLMLLAQTFDRVCIVGNIAGCPRSFSESFARFAATARLDISRKDEALKIEAVLDTMEARTQKVVDALRAYLYNQPNYKFRYRSLVIQNLIDKLQTARDKLSKQFGDGADARQFYENVDAMNQALFQLRDELEVVQDKKIVDLYTREVVFLNFIKAEKPAISQHVYDRISQANGAVPRAALSRPCVAKRSCACMLKQSCDRLYFSVIIGSIVLSILLAI
ncbi:hypothetical protein PAPHI01_1499 [Pancytospora philotis]|nr:hypothetical protein PAPHI01_1499 [Pancytospora philotis]